MSETIPEALELAESPAGPDEKPERSLTPFFVLWSSQALSLVGTQAVQFALIWWLTRRTGSATVLATATLLGLLPQVVLGPLIGTLIDRWNRKRVMLWADALVAGASLVLAWLYASGSAGTGHVLALLFVRALGSAFHGPAMLASTSLMVPGRHLTRIQGLNQALQGGLNIVSAPLGALLLAVMSMAGVMLVDVGSALLAIVPLLAITVPQPRSPSGDVAVASSIRRELADGFRYLWARPGHLVLVGMSSLVNFCLVPAFALLPLLVLEHLRGDAAQLGWISAAFGLGVLAGGILLGLWGGTGRRIVTAMVAMIVLGFAVAAVGLTPPGGFVFALAAMFSVGLVVPSVNGPIMAILQATIAPDYQGRVFTLMGSLGGATAPLGLLLAAPVAELIGVRSWYLAGAVACLAMALAGLSVPALMRIEGDASE